MPGPIVLWPREVTIRNSASKVTVEFVSDFPRLREQVNLYKIFDMAFRGRVISAQSDSGRHRVVLSAEDRSALEIKKAANRVVSALTLIHPQEPAPNLTMALGWHFYPGTREHTTLGRLERDAKWNGDTAAVSNLADRVKHLLSAHSLYATAASVVYVDSSKHLAFALAEGAAQALGGVPMIACQKTDPTVKQHDSDDPLDFDTTVGQISGGVTIPTGTIPEPVLVVDDLYRSGGTILEVTRCLHERGVSRVFCLTAAKTPQFHRKT